MSTKNILKQGGLFLFLVAFDQMIKFLITKFFPEIIFKNFSNFLNISVIFQMVLLVVIIISIFYLYKNKIECFKNIVPFTLIIAGAFSNLLDRLFRSFVVDYIPVLSGYFNFSDILIITGFLIIIFSKKVNSC